MVCNCPSWKVVQGSEYIIKCYIFALLYLRHTVGGLDRVEKDVLFFLYIILRHMKFVQH